MGLVSFNMFINDLDEWIEEALIKFADNPKLGEITDSLEHRLWIWKDFNRLDIDPIERDVLHW